MTHSICWNCQAPVGNEDFCEACRRILPHPPGHDFFGLFGLPRKLNIDLGDLEKRFYTLSRRLHPDNFYHASEKERQLSLEKTAVLNDAYRTLRDPLSRAEYLLRLEGQGVAVTPKQAPPELLEEAFEVNEWLAELRTAPGQQDQGGHLAAVRRQLEEAKERIESRAEAFRDELMSIFERWDAAVDSGRLNDERQTLLNQLSQALAKRNYLRNLARDLSQALQGR